MTQAERTRTIKYVLAESSRWRLHRRRDTKKINIPGCRKKIRKERKEKRKTKSRKQGTKAGKQENRTQGVSIATNLPISATKPRRGPLPHHLPFSSCSRRQRYQMSLLPLSSPPPCKQINENEAKLPGLGGCSNSGSTY